MAEKNNIHKSVGPEGYMIIDSDFHNHTARSRCAHPDATVSAIVKGLEQLHFRFIGISDHYYEDEPMAQLLADTRKEVASIKTEIKVQIGVEIDMLSPGIPSASEKLLSGYDYIMAACPHYQNKKVVYPISSDYSSIAQNAFDYMISTAALQYIDIIVHPFDARGLSHRMERFDLTRMMKRFTKTHYISIIDLLIKNHIAVELTERLRQPDYFSALFPFLSLCRECEVLFSFGSDSHAISHLGSIWAAADAIEKIGVSAEKIWKGK